MQNPDGSRKFSHEEFPESYAYALQNQTEELTIIDFNKALEIEERVKETLKNLTEKSKNYPENAGEFKPAFAVLSEVQQKLDIVLQKN